MPTIQDNQSGTDDPFTGQLPGGGAVVFMWLIVGAAVLVATAMAWEAHSRGQVRAEAARVEREARRALRDSFRALRRNQPAKALDGDAALGEKIAWLRLVESDGYVPLALTRLFVRAKARAMLDDRDGWRLAVADFDAGMALLRRGSGQAREFGLRGRGEVWFRLGGYAEALRDFDAVIAVNPSSGAAYYWRSLAKSALGDAAGAAGDAERARALGSWPPLRDFGAGGAAASPVRTLEESPSRAAP